MRVCAAHTEKGKKALWQSRQLTDDLRRRDDAGWHTAAAYPCITRFVDTHTRTTRFSQMCECARWLPTYSSSQSQHRTAAERSLAHARLQQRKDGISHDEMRFATPNRVTPIVVVVVTPAESKKRRYMDDLLVFYASNEEWDHQRLLTDLTNECYFPPLRLEDGTAGTFLETSFEITATNSIRHWLKNQNAQETKVWRYAHFASQAPFSQKRAVLMACLLKVEKMASDDCCLLQSASQKVAEFIRLQYPRRMLWTACTTMGVKTRNTVWFQVRDNLHSKRFA